VDEGARSRGWSLGLVREVAGVLERMEKIRYMEVLGTFWEYVVFVPGVAN
jgi:hypothetical protein